MELPMSPQEAFAEALKRAGSQAALAAIVGKQQPAISKRLNGKGVAQPDEVLPIERELLISRHVLRPDLHGPNPAPPAASTAPPPYRADRPTVRSNEEPVSDRNPRA